MTAEVMTLQFPGGVIVRLGHDLAGSFPSSLATIAHPELNGFLQRFDITKDSVKGTGAQDWSVLAQRMHLIMDLFRRRHEWDALFEAPFTAVQIADMQNGRRPLGPL